MDLETHIKATASRSMNNELFYYNLLKEDEEVKRFSISENKKKLDANSLLYKHGVDYGTGVYMFNNNPFVLYIGCTKYLNIRLNQHFNNSPFVELSKELQIIKTNRHKELEEELISWYKPVFNKIK